MQSINPTTITFKFVKYGNQKDIEINFGQDHNFLSCPPGTDLADFDALLEYCIPDIDLEKINYPIARWWERELYRSLVKCKRQRSLVKAFSDFCERIGKKYRKKKLTFNLARTTQRKALRGQTKRFKYQG